MNYIRISHPEQLKVNSWTAPGKSNKSSGKLLSWKSSVSELPRFVSCIADFGELSSFDSIEIDLHPEYPHCFPSHFRFEVSDDNRCWQILLQESDFRVAGGKRASWRFSLANSRYLKLLALSDKKGEEGYFVAFGEIKVKISGNFALKASSELDRLWVKENLFDGRPDYGWSSAPRSSPQKEFIRVDLGAIHPLCEIRLLSKADPDTLFPEDFQFLYSEDNIKWHFLLQEDRFFSEPGTWYRWSFQPIHARHLQMSISKGGLTREGKNMSQIIEMELYAMPEQRLAPNAASYASYASSATIVNPASVTRPGIVRLALDGESKQGVAVQASDRRLKDATTEFKGIVELAANGEEKEGKVVQGHDRRLRYANEEMPGIVRLARHGEQKDGCVVQSGDSRLQRASESKIGIVELAADGENKKGAAVQGSDRRLRMATTKLPGIVLLAEDGASHPNQALQSNDRRIRDANAEQKGVTRFARHGESSKNAALQSDDPRLLPATTERKGIVELAANGERREGVVVQGHDRRLQRASEESFGIVRFSPKGSAQSGAVVQADDPRLSDARKPLPHHHDYSPRVHDFNAHSGTIRLETEQGQKYSGLGPPPIGHAPISAVNKGDGAGITGRGKIDGVSGAGSDAGIVGLGLGKGIGMVGAARSGCGGLFVSDRGYGVVAGGKVKDRELGGSPFALLSQGVSHFKDTVFLRQGAACLALYLPVDESEVLAVGDLLVTSETGGRLHKSRGYGESGIVGVVVDKAALVLNPPPGILPTEQFSDKYHPMVTPQGHALVAIQGIVDVRIAMDVDIKAGDVLVSSVEAGSVEPLDPARYRPGTICARSLEGSISGRSLLPALLICS